MGERMKRRAQQGRRYRWVLLASVWLVMAVNVFAESASVRPSGNVQLDLRTDVGWESDHFRYMGQDFSEALLMQAGQTVDLTLLTHKTVPHRCMLDFSTIIVTTADIWIPGGARRNRWFVLAPRRPPVRC